MTVTTDTQARSGGRDTLVIEFCRYQPVGREESGAAAIRRALADLAKAIGLVPIRPPVAHLSPKFGFSG